MNDPRQDQLPAVLSLEPRQRPRKRVRLIGSTVVSAAAHFGIVAAILLAGTEARQLAQVDPIMVRLVTWKRPVPAPQPAPKPSPDVPKHEAHETPPPLKSLARKTPAPPVADFLPAAPSEKTSNTESQGELTDADLAGASTAGTGSGGGGDCNMARRLQNALRKDSLVQAAVAEASGSTKAIMVWNGDWVQSHSEDGKGLAAVREAIVWEIAFAPPACRAEHVHGLMVLTLTDGSETAKLAVGHGEWRWSDLLALHHNG